MGSSPKAPAAPDPTATGNAQTKSNEATALYQAQLNNVNQVTPYGNLTYSQSGGQPSYNMDAYNKAMAAYQTALSAPQTTTTQQFYPGEGDPRHASTVAAEAPTMPQLKDFMTSDGGAPQFTSTITLSPQQQALLDAQNANQQQALSLAGGQLSQAQQNLSTPYSLSGVAPVPGNGDISAYQDQITGAINSRLQPQLDHSQELLDTKLANQGIVQGSDAWNKAQTLNSQAVNDAYQQSILSGVSAGSTLFNEGLAAHQQGVSDYDATRNAPLNAYNSLNSGVQVQNPTFAASGNNSVAPTNIAGITQNAYQSALNSYNQQVAGNNSTTNSLFGLAGSLGSGFLGSSAGGSWLASLFGGGADITEALGVGLAL